MQTPKKTNHEIKTSIFTCFFNINIKIPHEQSFFLSFTNTFSEADVRKCSSK